ncbi:DUF4124 domain-containing protein [Seongchinamella sediminis]|uniref:DUF4124 domain-containing protein n=1 Tax=Seongchinamella sediminis TaxID=2283635 RepID=A0A3L7E4L5_9GAMM|nr:DUF4124 domain-containing protein [Seongchinamella sediminis]RLQ23543.1 DUF4124 domain-containing protein [Seongchinamella sediminis]
MKHGLAFAVLLAISSTASAQTQFYKCKDQGGQPVFSQRPCGENAQTGTITGPERNGGPVSTSPAPTATAATTTAPSQEPDTWDKVEASRLLREAEREIDRREDRIDYLEAERDKKIAALRNKKRYANNNLAGATWEESISSEMQAVNDQYQSKIDSQQRKIDRLQEQADRVSERL